MFAFVFQLWEFCTNAVNLAFHAFEMHLLA